MDCAWMQTNQTFRMLTHRELMNTCLSKQLVLAGDLAIDGCVVELKDTK